MNTKFAFERAVLRDAIDRSRKAMISSASSMLRTLLSVAITASVITGSILATTWWPILGALALVALVFGWNLATAPRRLWAQERARAQDFEGKLLAKTDAVATARWLERQFKGGEVLLTERLEFDEDFDEWKVEFEKWCTEVEEGLGEIHEKERFMFHSVGFEARVECYRADDRTMKHRLRTDDLRARLVKLRFIIDRMYGLAATPGGFPTIEHEEGKPSVSHAD